MALTPPPRRVPRVLFAIIAPLQAFFRQQASSSFLLLAATVTALAWANSPWRSSYHALFDLPVAMTAGGRGLSWPLREWTNEVLMAFFFLVAGLEIKRELSVGELRTARHAALPLLAAMGGMVAPALVYTSIARGTASIAGWGIPTATDIAFALGALTVVRRRVPPSLFIFLTALAIFDDLGAILLIALFYGGHVDMAALGAAALLVAILFAMARARVGALTAYLIVGALLWAALLRAGVHATLAGVALGFAIPARAKHKPSAVLDDLHVAVEAIREAGERGGVEDGSIAAIERHLEAMQAPLDRLLHGLARPVAYGVVPLFALANAGVPLGASLPGLAMSPGALATFFGLVLGKPLGVFGATWLAVRSGVARRPTGARWRDITVVSLLAGVGFTMSLFIGMLAFPDDGSALDATRVAVLGGSAVCALLGITVALLWGRENPAASAPTQRTVVVDFPRFEHGYALARWEPDARFEGQTLAEADLRRRHGVFVLGAYGAGDARRALRLVGGDYVLHEGETLLLVGEEARLAQFTSERPSRAARVTLRSPDEL